MKSDGVWRRLPASLVRAKSTVGAIYRPVRARVEGAMLDRRIETSRAIGSEQLGFVPGTGFGFYEASGWYFLRRGLQGYEVTRSDVFADFGSGKGRIVYQAARLPFGRVVGYELIESLNAVARENVERNRTRLRCQNVELITADISTVPVPDDVTVAYIFNSVQGDLFRRLIENIVASLERRPRRFRLIYAWPVLPDEVTRSGHLRLIRRSRGIRRDLDPTVFVYESIGI